MDYLPPQMLGKIDSSRFSDESIEAWKKKQNDFMEMQAPGVKKAFKQYFKLIESAMEANKRRDSQDDFSTRHFRCGICGWVWTKYRMEEHR